MLQYFIVTIYETHLTYTKLQKVIGRISENHMQQNCFFNKDF